MWLENSTFFFIARTKRNTTPHGAEIRNQNGWTVVRSAVFVSLMWRSLCAFFFLTSAALGQQQSTAYDALRVVGTQLNPASVSRVISVTGSDGDPQPITWRVLVAERAAPGGVREVEVENGQIVAQRTPTRGVIGSTEGATIKTARLNLDSSGAFSVASYTADKAHTNFSLVSYTLRNDSRGYPVWIVTLHDERRRPLGTIHIGANRGNVTRVEGMYQGANMAQVQEDRASRASSNNMARIRQGDSVAPDGVDAAEEEDDGDVNPVKQELKRLFRRSKHDAQRIFGRVRSSFEEYYERVRR